jgi:hypothetical protein
VDEGARPQLFDHFRNAQPSGFAFCGIEDVANRNHQHARRVVLNATEESAVGRDIDCARVIRDGHEYRSTLIRSKNLLNDSAIIACGEADSLELF